MENLQDDVIELNSTTTNKSAVYDGIGFVNANDMAQYFVSLDPDPGKTYVFKIFKIRNEGFLIHLNNGTSTPLMNPSNNIYQINFEIKKKVPTPKEYKVVLYHENRTIDKNEAKRKFEDTKRVAPDSTGRGTIRS